MSTEHMDLKYEPNLKAQAKEEDSKYRRPNETLVPIGGTRLERVAIVASLIPFAALAGVKIAQGLSHDSHHSTPIERHGDHHGSTGMPSTEHLNKFAHEHDINLNQK